MKTLTAKQAANLKLATADQRRAVAITNLKVARARRNANPDDELLHNAATAALAAASKACADRNKAQAVVDFLDRNVAIDVPNFLKD